MSRRLLLPLCVVLLGSIAGLEGPVASSPEALYDQGNTAYEEGRFDDAVSAYEQILQYGLRDPRVHYNLGNALFKAGHLGRAILHYERTLRLDPTDPEARENLGLAREKIRDRVAEPELPAPLLAVRGWLETKSTGGMTLFFLLVYFAAAALIGAIPLTHGYARRRILGGGALVVGFCAALAGGALYYKVKQITAPYAIVVVERMDVRSGPAADNTVLFTVHEGTRLEVRNRLEGWYQISLPNALSGWIPESGVERV
jgi:tetratricopeptide (TPR) repeat protein